jgi:hypothetical protein
MSDMSSSYKNIFIASGCTTITESFRSSANSTFNARSSSSDAVKSVSSGSPSKRPGIPVCNRNAVSYFEIGLKVAGGRGYDVYSV